MVFCNVGLLSSCCCLSSSICCRVKKGFLRLLTGSSGWARDHSSKTSGWRHCTWRRRFFLCLVVKWHISQEKGFSPAETQYHEYRLSIRGGWNMETQWNLDSNTNLCVWWPCVRPGTPLWTWNIYSSHTWRACRWCGRADGWAAASCFHKNSRKTRTWTLKMYIDVNLQYV